MKTLALLSQKGGSGKSTLAVHLAALAAETQKVILMDLDPQGSAMEWGNRRGNRPPDITPAHPASLAKEIESEYGKSALEGLQKIGFKFEEPLGA